MSFVFAAPELVTDAAGALSAIGSSLGEATATAAGPTTSLATAAADEVSLGISELFGNYGRQFQALSAQATAFHNELVSLLGGSAAAYLNTEIANAQQGLLTGVTGVTSGSAAPAAPLDPILGGLAPVIIGGNGSGGGLFGSLQDQLTSTISGSPLGPIFAGAGRQLGNAVSALIAGNPLGALQLLFPPGPTPATGGNPYLLLFEHTQANLSHLVADISARPFPVLNQFIANQGHYANMIGTNVSHYLQDPNALANDMAVGQHGATTYDYAGAARTFQATQSARSQITNAAMQNFITHVQQRLPIFYNDLGGVGHSVQAGDYHGAVATIPRAVVHLLVDGINVSNLSSFNIQGPAGDLLPLTSLSGSQQQDLVNLIPPGTIQRQIGQHLVNVVNGSMTSVGMAAIGWPIATLDGLATGATVFGSAMQAGDGVAALSAVLNMPAYVLDGFLNGNTVVDITLPLTATVDVPVDLLSPLTTVPVSVGIGAPLVLHMPFTGILTPAQPISATLEVPIPATGASVPLNISVPGYTIGGAVPTLLVDLPRSVANAISSQ